MSLSTSQTPAWPALDLDLFAGLLDAIKPQSQLQEEDVTDDLNGEGETLGSLVPGRILEDSNSDDNSWAIDGADLIKAVDGVSKGVSERTHNEYQRYILYPLGRRLCSLLMHLLDL